MFVFQFFFVIMFIFRPSLLFATWVYCICYSQPPVVGYLNKLCCCIPNLTHIKLYLFITIFLRTVYFYPKWHLPYYCQQVFLSQIPFTRSLSTLGNYSETMLILARVAYFDPYFGLFHYGLEISEFNLLHYNSTGKCLNVLRLYLLMFHYQDVSYWI